MTSEPENLVLGCGQNQYGDDWVHLDRADLDHVDVQHDLNTGELPFEDNRFEFIKARHVLEHVKDDAYVSLLEEICRVAEPGAVLYVVVPHFLSWNAHTFDHKRKYGRRSFDVFTSGHSFENGFPDLFSLEAVHFDFLENEYVNNCRRIYGDEKTAKFVPNSVNEMVFELEVL